jgi:ribonuclease Z
LKVTILGAGSATPSLLRNPSAQLLTDDHESYLIDCGEGTQFQLLKLKAKTSRIKNIFITHLHGDHFFGLIGLISSFNLAHRTEPLTIFGPKGLDEIITLQLKYASTFLHFKLTFVEVNVKNNYNLIDNERITVSTIPLDHRIPCCGFLFSEKPKLRNLIKEKLPTSISINEMRLLKEGKNVFDIDNSIKYNFKTLTIEPSPAKKYAYCSDTAFLPKIVEIIDGSDALYHEATFTNELLDRANFTHHSTAAQAGEIAKLANVKKLLIGHFSSRYLDLDVNLKEAKSVFNNTEIAIEGGTYLI